ncbi:MAG: hypothetical protein WC054_02730 [Candidatus Nanopelagicales bacterium]
MTAIPVQWDRVEAILLPLLRAEFPDFTIRNVKPKQPAPFGCVVIRADLQQHSTPLTRYCRIGVSSFAVRESGEPDIAAAHDNAADVAAFITTLPGQAVKPFLVAEIESGPTRMADDAGEYAYVNVLTQIHAA